MVHCSWWNGVSSEVVLMMQWCWCWCGVSGNMVFVVEILLVVERCYWWSGVSGKMVLVMEWC